MMIDAPVSEVSPSRTREPSRDGRRSLVPRSLALGIALACAPMMIAPVVASESASGAAGDADDAMACAELLDVTVRPLAESEPVRLCDVHRGEALLIVNTASQCGFTYQYEGLEALDAELRDQGFRVVGFPSGDFANQEYEDEAQIAEFCRSNFSIQFPMYERTHASRAQAAPGSLFHRLGTAAGEFPRWNFHKYLIDRDGQLVGSFGTRVEPNDPNLRAAIESVL